MTTQELYKYIDHTALRADTSWEDILALCLEAVHFGMASVCIPSSYVKRTREKFPDLRISTVIGFPFGNANTAAKVAETRQAIEDGADEIDMVINIGFVKNGWYEIVEDEISCVREAAGSHILKVIVETCYLTEEEKIALCVCVSNAGADYVKTSTGFGTAGAKLADVRLMREHLDPDVKIKASGGIRTRGEMEQFIEAGCDRIGTSSAIEALSK